MSEPNYDDFRKGLIRLVQRRIARYRTNREATEDLTTSTELRARILELSDIQSILENLPTSEELETLERF